MLFKNKNEDKIIILKDKDIGYKRLDKRTKDILKIIENEKQIYTNMDFSDIHISKRIWKPGQYQIIIKNILNNLSN